MLSYEEDPPLTKSKTNKQLPKLYAISLSGFIGQNLIHVYVPYFAIALGASYHEQGLVTSIRTISNSLTQSFWGTLSDKHGRRRILLFDYAVIALTTLLYTFSTGISLFLGLLAIQGFFGLAVIPVVMNSMLGDLAIERERGVFVGKITSFVIFGSVPMVLLFGYLLDRQELVGPNQYHLAFLAAGMFILIASLVIMSLKETLTTKPVGALPPPWSIIRQHRVFKRFLVIDSAFIAIMAFAWPLYPFVVTNIVHATNTQLSAIWAGWCCSMALAQKFGGALSDRIGRKPLLIISRSLLFLMPLGSALTNRWPTWILLFGTQSIAGFLWGLSLILEQLIALDLAPTDQKTIFAGTIFTVTGVTGFLGSLFGGTITQLLSPRLGPLNALLLMLYISTLGRLILGLVHVFIEETAPAKKSIGAE